MWISLLRTGAVLATFALGFSAACVWAQQSPEPAAKATAPPPPEASPNDIDGSTLFAGVCGFCHQDGGRSEGKGPKLAGTKRSHDFILARIRNGQAGRLPAVSRALSAGHIAALPV